MRMLNEARRRFWGIILKWVTVLSIIIILAILKVFHALFALLIFVMQEVNRGLIWLGEPTQQGFDAYWAEMWLFWLLFYVVFFILFAIYYFGYWKRKRPDLIIGGVKDGRVIWIKGVRQGLIYDCWDAWNYIKGAGSPFERGSRTRGSRTSMETNPGMLQDPLKIPLGRGTIRRIIYFRRPWSLKVQRLFIQANTRMVITHGRVSLPEGYIINKEDPLMPGARVLIWVNKRPGFREHDPVLQQEALEKVLVVAKDNVRGSVAANPSIITTEYQEGSIGRL
jgi:hypothetical protein